MDLPYSFRCYFAEKEWKKERRKNAIHSKTTWSMRLLMLMTYISY